MFNRLTALTVLFFSVIGSANASLLGDDVLVEWIYPNASSVFTSDTVTVGAGAEVVCNGSLTFGCSFGGYPDNSVFIDISSFDIDMTFTNGATTFLNTSFNGFRFSDLDFSDASILTGVVLDTNIAGLDMSRVAFGADFVEINLHGLQTFESYWGLSLVTSSVPEPGTMFLFGLGLVGLGLSRKKLA